MEHTLKDSIPGLLHQTAGLTIQQTLALLAKQFPNQVTLSSSFSFEDQLISHDILNNHLPISIFTLDTGRLFAETYSVWSATNEKYQTHIKAFYPNQDKLQEFVEAKGPNSFYELVE